MAHAHTFKTDPWHVKEATQRRAHPGEFRREHSLFTKHRRDAFHYSTTTSRHVRRFLSAMVGQFINVREVA